MTSYYQIFIFETAEKPLEHCFKHAKKKTQIKEFLN